MKNELLIQDFNYHTHTPRCQHAFGSEEDYIKTAIKMGYKQLGFADHAPVARQYRNRNRMHIDEFDDYCKTITRLKEKYKDKIEIYLGIEAEPYPENQETIDMFFDRLDYVILSIHGHDVYHQFNFAMYNDDTYLEKYCQIIEEQLPKRNWLYLAHPDYFLRNQNDFNEKCIEITHRICQAALKSNTIFEINLTGIYFDKIHFVQGDYYFYPHPLFWKIVSEYQIPCVYGLDAHHPSILTRTDYFEICKEELKGINLNIIDHPLLHK